LALFAVFCAVMDWLEAKPNPFAYRMYILDALAILFITGSIGLFYHSPIAWLVCLGIGFGGVTLFGTACLTILQVYWISRVSG